MIFFYIASGCILPIFLQSKSCFVQQLEDKTDKQLKIVSPLMDCIATHDLDKHTIVLQIKIPISKTCKNEYDEQFKMNKMQNGSLIISIHSIR